MYTYLRNIIFASLIKFVNLILSSVAFYFHLVIIVYYYYRSPFFFMVSLFEDWISSFNDFSLLLTWAATYDFDHYKWHTSDLFICLFCLKTLRFVHMPLLLKNPQICSTFLEKKWWSKLQLYFRLPSSLVLPHKCCRLQVFARNDWLFAKIIFM